MAKIIIVTGGAGFIGSNIVRELNKLGHKKYYFSRFIGEWS